jgi:hypothetical protein
MHRTPILVLAVLGVLLACPPCAEGAPLLPGDTLSPVPPLAPPSGSVAGHVDATFQSTSGPPFTGRLSEDVIRKADNTLAFVYQFANASAPLLTGAGLSDYGMFDTDVGITGTGVAPVRVSRSGGAGDTVTFDFSPGVGTGASSTLLVIDTDATAFGLGSVGLTGTGGAAARVAALGPTPAPEPGTLALLLAGLPVLGAAAGWRRWRGTARRLSRAAVPV